MINDLIFTMKEFRDAMFMIIRTTKDEIDKRQARRTLAIIDGYDDMCPVTKICDIRGKLWRSYQNNPNSETSYWIKKCYECEEVS